MSVQVIDTLKPKNNGSFPVVEAEDVAVSDELRLPEALNQKAEQTDLEELSSELENKADTSDITNLQSQIDQIAQAAGTGTADTEVAQARVGADGTSYQTLKARLDAENEDVTGQLDIINTIIKTNNLMDVSDVETGGLYLASSGEWYESASWWSTGLIPVDGGITIYITANYIDNNGFQWTGFRADGTTWDGQGAVVTSSDNKNASFTTNNSGALKYIRIGFKTSTTAEDVIIRTSENLDVYINQEDVNGLNEKFSEIEAEFSATETKIADINDAIYETLYKEASDLDWQFGFINISGVINEQTASFKYTEKVYVNQGDVIQYSIRGYNNVVSVIAAYDASDNFISAKSIYYDSSYGTAEYVQYTGNYTVTEGVAYLRFCRNLYDGSTIFLRIPNKVLVTDELDEKIDTLDTKVEGIEETLENFDVMNQWKDKRISAFGTSLTDTGNSENAVDPNGDPTGKFLKYLVAAGEFAEIGPLPARSNVDKTKTTNYGIAGGKISGHILYYIRYYLHDGPASKLGNEAELILIEGSVNDYATNTPLGNVGDTVPYTHELLPDSTSEGTFAGACYCAFTEAQTYAPNSVVVFLTDSTGKMYSENGNNYWQGRKNSLNLTQYDYIEMAKKVAEYVGIPVIDCGSESMINAQNPQFLVDWIHHTELGGKQYASAIWSKLKNLPLKILSID